MSSMDKPRTLRRSPPAPGSGRAAWRRKWRRVPAETRRTAAAALGDVFAPRKRQRAVLGFLLASLALHAMALPLAGLGSSVQVDLAASENTYLSRVLEKQRARAVSRDLSGKVTMPPPPEDPEAFVSKTMADSLTTDIDNVIGNMLDVTVTSRIKAKVSASLKAELDAAAQNIAEKKLSEAEINAIQESFRRKAHAAALGALKEYRIETQVKRAAMSTTQWYEEKVSRVLFRNLHYEMYRRPGWNAGPRLWYSTWSGGRGTPHWHGLGSPDRLARKLRYLERGLTGQLSPDREDRDKTKATHDSRGRKFVKDSKGRNVAVMHAGWPGPSLEQARYLKQQLHYYYNRSAGGYKNQEILPSWNDYLYSGPQCYGLISEYYPHRREEMKQRTDQVDGLWKEAFRLLAEYVALGEEDADPEEMAPVQKSFFQTAKKLFEACGKLFPDHYALRACQAINHAILLEHLRTDKLQADNFQRWQEKMVQTLWPLIRTYAEGQFEEGIIQRDGTVEEALKKFGSAIIPLVRRDVKKLLPREKFNRIIFYPYTYRSPITGERCPPSDADYADARKRMADALKQHPKLAAYAEARRELLAKHFHDAVDNTVQVIRRYIFARGLLTKHVDVLAEGVDYSDKVQEKLDARKAAKEGRGQDLARLNKDGLPDTSARLVALQYGLSRGGLVEPVVCELQPAFITQARPELALWGSRPRKPPLPAKWGFETQARLPKAFPNSPAYESIPFLNRFPRLDGDLADWGKIRPLILRRYEDGRAGPKQRPILLYAAWNYQGFFFGYRVHQPADEFFYPEQYRTKARKLPSWAGGGFTGRVQAVREKGFNWMCKGDHLRLLLDTLDARSETRGDPHTQEFVVVPMGSDTDPTLPGFERIIQSKRDAQATEWRRVVAAGRGFLRQPPPEHGPDGTGPYRVCRMKSTGPIDQQCYTVEVFIPRSLFHVPVFAPGWHIGFDCTVATGPQGQFRGQYWSPAQDAVPEGDGPGLCPKRWGDLMLLGTDPYIVVQDADPEGSVSRAVIPGHSYLLTVIDPDRNVYASAKDNVLVSAEVAGPDRDMEVFMLMESEPNSGIFRGYVNTQPGSGRQVQGVIECLPGEEIRFGYVDIGNAQGKRNVIFDLRLPTAAVLATVAHAR